MVALALAGCTRSYTAPAGHRELGQSCTENGECTTSVCAQGVCCDRTCDGTFSCDVAGSAGTCVQRPYGASCSDSSMCALVDGGPGFCADGVCCDSACTGNCVSCANPGQVGTCGYAPDNTDPHGDCGGCAACFGGDCGPAFANTDPKQECEPGYTCSGNWYGASGDGGSCAIADGFPCETTDTCAGYSGYCIGWRCMEVSYFHVDDYPFLRTDRHRTPIGLGVGPDNSVGILIDADDGTIDDGGYLGSVVAVVGPGPIGPWTSASVEYNAIGLRAGAVSFTGDIAQFAVDSQIPPDSDLAYQYGYSGIYVQAISSRGVLQGFDDPDPGAADVRQVALSADARGQVTLASVTGDGSLRVVVRDVHGTWGDPQVFDGNAEAVASARADGDVHVFTIAGGHLQRWLADGGAELATGIAHPCSGPLYASTAPDPGGDQVGFTLSCGGQPYLAAFAPNRSDVARWRFVPAPATTLFYGTDYGDDTSYPLSKFLPSGGRSGTVIFSGLQPYTADAGPVGGYIQTFWLNLDGTLTYAYSSLADNDYGYVSMAANGSPSGAPISAYDTVVDIDGGTVVSSSTLLIQSYFP